MKRMCMIFIALFILAMAVPAMATETRVQTMGSQDLFIQDDYNIWTWTSTVNNYPRHMIVDHNAVGGGNSRVGMVLPFMKNAVVGAFFSDQNYSYGVMPMSANQRLDLFYGYRATSFDLGIHVDWWGDKTEQVGTQSTAVMGAQVGLGFNANGNMLELDAFYKNLDFTNETLDSARAITTRDAGSALGAAARYLYAYNNMVTLVPAVSISQTKLSQTERLWEDKNTNVDLGVGCNTMPLQGTEFISSVGLMFNKTERTGDSTVTAVDTKTNTIPYVKFGADIQVKPWLNFRVGAEKWIVQSTELISKLKNTNSNFMYAIGAGVMLGDVQFDCEVANDWLNRGPYLLSGTPGGPMFPKISFKYDFR